MLLLDTNRAPTVNLSVVRKQAQPETQDIATQASGRMQPYTTMLLVVGIVCFALLLLGFLWVAKWKPKNASTANGTTPRAAANGQRPTRGPDISERLGLWRGWYGASHPSQAPITNQGSHSQLSGTSTKAQTNLTRDTMGNFRSGAYDLDNEINLGMIQAIQGGAPLDAGDVSRSLHGDR